LGVWFRRYAGGQTDRPTDTLITMLHSPARGGVITWLIAKRGKINILVAKGRIAAYFNVI